MGPIPKCNQDLDHLSFCRNEVEKTSFEFICPFCFDPWYEDIENGFETCVNENCLIFDKSLGIKKPALPKELKVEMETHHTEVIAKLLGFESSFLRRYLYDARRAIISDLHTRTRGIYIPKFFALNELLCELNSNSPIGSSTSATEVEDLIKLYTEYSEQLNMLDDILTLRRYLGPGVEKVYSIKYWSAFNQMLKNYGITTPAGEESEDLFKYLDVDAKAIKPFDATNISDLSEYFKNTFLYSSRLRLLFGLHRRTSQMFKYKVHLIDVAALLGLLFSIKEKIEYWPVDRLRRHFARHVPAGKMRDFSEFQNQFIDGKELAPIIVRDDGACCVDRDTILFFLHYLAGHEVEFPEGNQIQIMGDKKNEVASYFEDWIREQLAHKEYAVTDAPLEVDGHQYDIIAVNEGLKRILLVEAKYKDFSPSAISGKTLLEQELYDDKEGLLPEAIRQSKRHEFFLSHVDRFTKRVPVKEQLNAYAVRSFVVTKYPPLISRYKMIKLCSSEDFLLNYS